MNALGIPLLSLIIFVPLLGALATAFVSREIAGRVALIFSLVPLVLSIRALSLQAPLTQTGNADVERVQAPTGAGTSQWPSASTPLGRGVYLSVMPACIPGVDEPLWPGTQRTGRRR